MKKVEVSFEEKKARVVVDKKVTDEALFEAVAKPGPYRARIDQREDLP